MCNAEATLVYGLTVRAVDLLFAAHAWTRLEPTFRFFDLVFLRRPNGGLVTRDRGGGGGERGISRVPNEVWEEIRYYLVQEEIEISQDTLLGFVPCARPDHRRIKGTNIQILGIAVTVVHAATARTASTNGDLKILLAGTP